MALPLYPDPGRARAPSYPGPVTDSGLQGIKIVTVAETDARPHPQAARLLGEAPKAGDPRAAVDVSRSVKPFPPRIRPCEWRIMIHVLALLALPAAAAPRRASPRHGVLPLPPGAYVTLR